MITQTAVSFEGSSLHCSCHHQLAVATNGDNAICHPPSAWRWARRRARWPASPQHIDDVSPGIGGHDGQGTSCVKYRNEHGNRHHGRPDFLSGGCFEEMGSTGSHLIFCCVVRALVLVYNVLPFGSMLRGWRFMRHGSIDV